MPILPLYPRLLHIPHPFPLYTVVLSASASSMPRLVRALTGISAGSLHCSQIFLTSLWERTRRTEEATRKGSNPILRSLVMVLGASLVCRVERTRCPVSADLMAISAVSKSRISPTMMMSGSCLRKLLRDEAKLRPMSSLIWTWLIPWMLYSTGSSAVETFVVRSLSSMSAEYNDVVFPLPDGP